jgi:hypothetical protein
MVKNTVFNFLKFKFSAQIFAKNFTQLLRDSALLEKIFTKLSETITTGKRMRIFGADVAPDRIRFGQ